VAHHYLEENVKLNSVEDIVFPVLGDNRDFVENNIADRIVMGYLEDTHAYLSKALDILKEDGGIIHYHEKCPNELLKERPIEKVREELAKRRRDIESMEMRKIKSYAPGVSHVVLDIKVKRV
jgi:tRNA wybutosine-synthesizing protein 2